MGEQVVQKEIGPITYFNVYGKEIINKNEKEYRDICRTYHIMDWHGQYHDGIAHERRKCYKMLWLILTFVKLNLYRDYLDN